MKIRLLGAFVCLFALGLSSTAFASGPIVENPVGTPQPVTGSGPPKKYVVHIKQSPTPAYVDDPSISMSWNVQHTLSKKVYWWAHLSIPSHAPGLKCQATTYTKSTSHRRRGEIATVTFELGADVTEWCVGRAEIEIGVGIGAGIEVKVDLFLKIEGRIFNRP
jgi:hypothetical protein